MPNTQTSATEQVLQSGGSWIHTRKGLDLNGVLRYLYTFIASTCLSCLMIFLYSETAQGDHGALAVEFNRATATSEGLLYMVGALALIIFVSFVALTYRPDPESAEASSEIE